MMEGSHSNFLITGHGRSGTKFLSSAMNLSKEWTVLHEPDPKGLHVPFELVQKRFSQIKYGEVNSYLRLMMFDLEVDKKGVILRHPGEIWLSIANRCKDSEWHTKLQRLHDSVEIISRAIKLGVFAINFKRMTEDVTYLQSILIEFGIKDVEVDSRNLAPINKTTSFRYRSLSDFPKSVTDKLNIICEEWERECA